MPGKTDAKIFFSKEGRVDHRDVSVYQHPGLILKKVEVLSGLMAENYEYCLVQVLDRFGISRSLVEMCVKRKNG